MKDNSTKYLACYIKIYVLFCLFIIIHYCIFSYYDTPFTDVAEIRHITVISKIATAQNKKGKMWSF